MILPSSTTEKTPQIQTEINNIKLKSKTKQTKIPPNNGQFQRWPRSQRRVTIVRVQYKGRQEIVRQKKIKLNKKNTSLM